MPAVCADMMSSAVLRLQESRLSVSQAIQIAYSYSHCDYNPSQLVQDLLGEVQQQPQLLKDQTLTT